MNLGKTQACRPWQPPPEVLEPLVKKHSSHVSFSVKEADNHIGISNLYAEQGSDFNSLTELDDRFCQNLTELEFRTTEPIFPTQKVEIQ